MRFQPILWLANRIGPACRDGMGGISASNIMALLPALGVPQDQIGETAVKLIDLLETIRAQKNDG